MEAKAHAVGKILSERTRFCVPVYQRHYEWERREQWEPLWDDITEKADEVLQGAAHNFAHYLVALILSEGVAKLGQVPVKQIIDGQQRLTTLEIFLNALQRVSNEMGHAKLARALKGYLVNEDPDLMEDPDIEKFKLWPTRYDRQLYSAIVDLSFSELRDKYPGFYFKNGSLVAGQAPRLLSAIYFFHESIADFVGSGETGTQQQRLEALSDAVLKHFSIVVISLDEQDDAQTIFSTLNARGKPLSAMDLIRNDIFQRASASTNAEVLFEKKWAKEFEDTFWDVEERQGRLTRKRIEYFLANVLAAERAEVINLSKIYPEYKQYVKSLGLSTVDQELDRLLAYSPAYRGLRNTEAVTPLGRVAKHLADWDITTAFPLIMSAEIALKTDQEDLSRFYALLQAYTLRRAYCALFTKSYTNVFLSEINSLRERGWSRENLGRYLVGQTGE